jgi:hypothetical protein
MGSNGGREGGCSGEPAARPGQQVAWAASVVRQERGRGVHLLGRQAERKARRCPSMAHGGRANPAVGKRKRARGTARAPL